MILRYFQVLNFHALAFFTSFTSCVFSSGRVVGNPELIPRLSGSVPISRLMEGDFLVCCWTTSDPGSDSHFRNRISVMSPAFESRQMFWIKPFGLPNQRTANAARGLGELRKVFRPGQKVLPQGAGPRVTRQPRRSSSEDRRK